MIDVINKEEKDKVKREIAGRNMSIIFVGTTHVAEALNIILRFVSDDWKIEQCLVKLSLVAKAMTDKELAQQPATVMLIHRFGHQFGPSFSSHERQGFS